MNAPHDDRPWLRDYPKGIDWAALPPPSTVTGLFDAAAASYGDRPCMDFLGRRWTYAETAAQVGRVAAGLRRMGVAAGDRVGLCLPNTPYAVIAFFAALRIGAVVVNFSPLDMPDDLAAKAAASGTTVMIATDLQPSFSRVMSMLGRTPVKQIVICRFAQALRPVKGVLFRLLKRKMLASVPHGDDRLVAWDALASAPGPSTPAGARPDDTAVLQYTGGTTGTPKAAMLTHANLTANAHQVRAWFPRAEPGRERFLTVLPLFHVFAMTDCMMVPVAMGAEIILLPRYDYKQVVAALRRCRPTLVPGVPTLFKALLDGGVTKADLASVKMCISGGAPLPLEVKHAFERHSGAVLVEGYGLTEASPVCFCNPVEGAGREGTIGVPVPQVEARICAPDAPSVPLPIGRQGELQVRGPNVMKGYLNQPEETDAVVLPGGWLRTGDIGRMDADGYVTLVDRIKDIILCGGFNVYPRHVEEAIYRHPDVAAATAVGMPDDYRGESVAAFVQLKPGAHLDEAALLAFLKDKLSAVEMPRLIEIRAQLPRTAVGKLSRKELRAELLERRPS